MGQTELGWHCNSEDRTQMLLGVLWAAVAQAIRGLSWQAHAVLTCPWAKCCITSCSTGTVTASLYIFVWRRRLRSYHRISLILQIILVCNSTSHRNTHGHLLFCNSSKVTHVSATNCSNNSDNLCVMFCSVSNNHPSPNWNHQHTVMIV